MSEDEYREYLSVRGPLPTEPQFMVAEDQFADREGSIQAVAIV